MHSLRTALVALLIWGLATAGPALALPFIGKKPAPAAKPAPGPAASPAAAPPSASAASAAKPVPGPTAALEIKGFRSAAFGMTPAQVKAAVTHDFGAAAKVVQEGSNAADGTQFMLVSLEHLDPGPGPAQIGYVFGAASKTLTAVNVVWTTGAEPTQQQRAAIAEAGQQLAAYFQSGPAPARAPGLATFGANGIRLYSAVDKHNAGVEVPLDGMSYQRTGGDKPAASPPPKGPAVLRVAYMQDFDRPDVRTLKPGSF